jgi:hypothetical protein
MLRSRKGENNPAAVRDLVNALRGLILTKQTGWPDETFFFDPRSQPKAYSAIAKRRLPLEETMRRAKDHEIAIRNLSRAVLSARGIENGSVRSFDDGRAVTITEFPVRQGAGITINYRQPGTGKTQNVFCLHQRKNEATLLVYVPGFWETALRRLAAG